MDTHRTSNWSLVILFFTTFFLSLFGAYIDYETKNWRDLLTNEMMLSCLLISLISFFLLGVIKMMRTAEGYKYLTIFGSVFSLSIVLLFLSGERMEVNKMIKLDMFYSGFLCVVYFISRCIDWLWHNRKHKDNTEVVKQT